MDDKEVTITMSEKEWDQVFYALLTYATMGKVAKRPTKGLRQEALPEAWARTQPVLKALYKPRIASRVTAKIGSTIGDDWPQGEQE